MAKSATASKSAPAPKTAKADKAAPAEVAAKAGAAPAVDQAPAPDAPQFEYTAGFEVFSVPVKKLKANASRKPKQEAVAGMAKSIKTQGLLNPVVIGTDFVVVSGNTRLLAMRDVLGYDEVPCRIAVDPKTGDSISSDQAAAVMGTLAENLQRNNPTPIEMAKSCKAAIDAGLAANGKELAARIGVSAKTVSVAMSLAEKASAKLLEAIENDQITADAAATLVARCETHKEQDEALEIMLKAAAGKIGKDAVNAAVPATSRSGSSKKKGGRKPVRFALPIAACNTDDTGITASLVKTTGSDNYLVNVHFAITAEQVSSFARFDLEKQVQRAIAKLDQSEFKKALEQGLVQLK